VKIPPQWIKRLMEGAKSYYIDLGGILVEVDEETAKRYVEEVVEKESQ